MKVQYRAFSLPLFPGSCEEDECNRFLRSHTILQCHKELVQLPGASAVWTLLVEYALDASSEKPLNAKIDYREILSEADFVIFDRLRTLRKQLAESQGTPPYTILTNEQLAACARLRPTALAALKTIDGIGDGKAEKYGAAILSAIGGGLHEANRTSL